MATARVVMRLSLPQEVIDHIARRDCPDAYQMDVVEAAVADAIAEDPAIYQQYADPIVEVDVNI